MSGLVAAPVAPPSGGKTDPFCEAVHVTYSAKAAIDTQTQREGEGERERGREGERGRERGREGEGGKEK